MEETYALITGASKGIGKAMALALAQRKYNLLLVARSTTELEAVAAELAQKYKIKVAFLPIDLIAPDAARHVQLWCETNNYAVSILLNNAGYGLFGNFEELSLPEQTQMMQLNMQTLVELTYLFIPMLKKQPQGYILNVASTAAYQAVPTLSLYSATKAFVLSFSRGLRYELKANNISVSCLCPGPVATNFFNRAGLSALQATAEKIMMQPDEVAEIAIAGLFAKKAEIIPGILNTISANANRFLPKIVVESVAARLFNQQ